MSDQPSVVDTLRIVRGHLILARKAVIDARHLEALMEIDTLMQVAQLETERRTAVLERSLRRSKT